MSDTPRTDDVAQDSLWGKRDHFASLVAMTNLSRELERELAEARAALRDLQLETYDPDSYYKIHKAAIDAAREGKK